MKQKLHRLRNEKGAIDLASIMTGLIVIGLIGGVVAATIFTVIPWAQDNAAKHQLANISTAQNVHAGFAADASVASSIFTASTEKASPAKGKSFAYLSDVDSPLAMQGLMQANPAKYCSAPNEDGSMYASFALSGSGKLFYSTNRMSKPEVFTGSPADTCIEGLRDNPPTDEEQPPEILNPWNVTDDYLRQQIKEVFSLEESDHLTMSEATAYSNGLAAGIDWAGVTTAEGLEHSATTELSWMFADSLQDTKGFENIQKIDFASFDGTSIRTLELPALETVGGLEVNNNPQVSSVVAGALTTAEWVNVGGNNTAVNVSFPELEKADITLSLNPALRTANFENVTEAHNIQVVGNPVLTELNLPKVGSATGIVFSNNASLPSVTMAELESAENADFFNNTSLARISFSKLDRIVDRDITVHSNASLTDIEFPALETVNRVVDVKGGSQLATADFRSLRSAAGFHINNSGDAPAVRLNASLNADRFAIVGASASWYSVSDYLNR